MEAAPVPASASSTRGLCFAALPVSLQPVQTGVTAARRFSLRKTLEWLQVPTNIRTSARKTALNNGGIQVEGDVLIRDVWLLRLISQHAPDAASETVNRLLDSSSCLCFAALAGPLRPVQTATPAAQPGERRFALRETFDWLQVPSRDRTSARKAAKNNGGIEVEGDVHIKDDWLLRLISQHAPAAASETVDRLLDSSAATDQPAAPAARVAMVDLSRSKISGRLNEPSPEPSPAPSPARAMPKRARAPKASSAKRPRAPPPDECPICLEDLDASPALACGHRIHEACVRQLVETAWADGAKRTRGRGTAVLCPLCRGQSYVK